jgi:hypothetical protein
MDMAWILFCENKIKQANIYSRMHYYHTTNSLSIVIIVVYRVKVHPIIGHEGPKWEKKYSDAFFNLGARWGGWSTPRPGCFTVV